ncbi:MAG TPA: hypothetical protein VFY13_00725 [Luteolibacter sp.]|nr:hypothetical protein [Luteolibacter sp.]
MSSKSLSTTICSAILLGAVCAQAAPQMRDVVTGEELARQTQKNAANNPLAKLKVNPLPSEDPTKVNQPEDLIATSDFLSFGGKSTLIPKRAIIHVPKSMASRIQFEKGSQIVVWPTFFAANRGWITTLEVSREQAEGKVPFDEKVADNIRKSSNVVVATYKGGPISMLPPKVPEEPKEGKEGEAAADDKAAKDGKAAKDDKAAKDAKTSKTP